MQNEDKEIQLLTQEELVLKKLIREEFLEARKAEFKTKTGFSKRRLREHAVEQRRMVTQLSILFPATVIVASSVILTFMRNLILFFGGIETAQLSILPFITVVLTIFSIISVLVMLLIDLQEYRNQYKTVNSAIRDKKNYLEEFNKAVTWRTEFSLFCSSFAIISLCLGIFLLLIFFLINTFHIEVIHG